MQGEPLSIRSGKGEGYSHFFSGKKEGIDRKIAWGASPEQDEGNVPKWPVLLGSDPPDAWERGELQCIGGSGLFCVF